MFFAGCPINHIKSSPSILPICFSQIPTSPVTSKKLCGSFGNSCDLQEQQILLSSRKTPQATEREEENNPLKTNMSPENQWLEDVFPNEIVTFRDMLVFRGVIGVHKFIKNPKQLREYMIYDLYLYRLHE